MVAAVHSTHPRGVSKGRNQRVPMGSNGAMPSSALLFPGQGSHAEGMDEPYRGHPLLERGLELLGHDPFERLDEGTRFQQPALFLCSVAAWDAWREESPADAAEAVAAAGHSLGEYAALVAAGVVGFDEAVALVDERAAAMQAAADLAPGGMLAVLGGDQQAVLALAAREALVVANDNAPGQLVLSGALDAIERTAEIARDETGGRARRLDVAGAFHSPLMEPAAGRLAAALERTPVHPASIPVYSNGSAAPFTDVRRELAANLLRPVRWRETLLALRTAGVERFVELGPGAVLTGLVKRTLQAA
jgi:malonyl CoA-acyl carrier protein transacylase